MRSHKRHSGNDKFICIVGGNEVWRFLDSISWQKAMIAFNRLNSRNQGRLQMKAFSIFFYSLSLFGHVS